MVAKLWILNTSQFFKSVTLDLASACKRVGKHFQSMGAKQIPNADVRVSEWRSVPALAPGHNCANSFVLMETFPRRLAPHFIFLNKICSRIINLVDNKIAGFF